MLRTFLAKLPDFDDEEALPRALDHAEAFPQPHRALAFLTAWPDLHRAARLVTGHRPRLAGRPVQRAGSRGRRSSPCTIRWPRRSSIAACSTASSNPVAAQPTPMVRAISRNSTAWPAGWRRARSVPRPGCLPCDAAAHAWPQVTPSGPRAGLSGGRGPPIDGAAPCQSVTSMASTRSG